MNIVFLTLGMVVHLIFMFKRELLYKRQSFVALSVIASVMFFVSYALQSQKIGDKNFVVLLKIPLLSLIIFYFMKVAYFKIYRDDAIDTFWSMDISLMKDGIFNFLFWVLGLFIPAMLVYLII